MAVYSEKMEMLSEDVLSDLLGQKADPETLKTGFYDFDINVGGLKKGELVILAARPGMGKTEFAIDLIKRMCFEDEKSCLYFSCSDPEKLLLERMICTVAGLNHSQYTDIKDEDYVEKLENAANVIKNSRVMIDSFSVTPHEMEHALKCHQYYGEIDLIIIDDLQNLYSNDQEDKSMDKTYIVAGLKNIAERNQCPILLLSQIGRSVENRKDHRPRMSDIRKEGDFERYADKILFLYRQNYYYPEEQSKNVEIIVAHNKYGKKGYYFHIV